MNFSIYIILLIIIWSINPFCKKRLLKKIGTNNYLVINHILITFIIIFYFIYLFKKKKCSFDYLQKLDIIDTFYILFVAITTVIATIILLEGIKNLNISQLMPTITTSVIVLTLIISCFYGEVINIYKIGGIISILLGVYLININNI